MVSPHRIATTPRDCVVHVLDGAGHEVRRASPTFSRAGTHGTQLASRPTPMLPAEYEWIARGWIGPARNGRHFELHADGRTSAEYRLVESDGTVVHVLSAPSAPSGMQHAFGGTLANDGSMAVLWLRTGAVPGVVVYGPDGEVRTTISLPAEAASVLRIAWDGHRLAAVDDLRVWVLDEKGKLLSETWLTDKREHETTWECGIGPDLMWRVAFSPDPRVLWLHQGDRAREPIRRYALP